MAIKTAGIEMTVDFWETVFDKLEIVSTEDDTEDKIAIIENLGDRIRSTAYFDHTEANWTINRVRLYTGAVLVAETPVSITKTDRQSLTIVRKDILEGA